MNKITTPHSLIPLWPAAPKVAVATFLVAASAFVQAGSSSGKIVVSGDEWAFSDGGFPDNPNYISNVVKWFELTPNGSGKSVLILDGQSWNSGFGGTYGAFGSQFRGLLTNSGLTVTYRGYTDDPVAIAGYNAVFVDGLMTKFPTLTNDLADFVRGGGAVYVAGGTGTFGGGASVEVAYWQPFFTAATGLSDFGLSNNGWFAKEGTLNTSGPVGAGVTALDWYMGQDVRVGSSPNASAAIWDSLHTLVAIWSASTQARITSIQELAGGSMQLTGMGLSNLSYTVWGNIDLGTSHWVSVGSGVAVGTNIQFVDQMATNFTRRFYRFSQP
jgi:hypothetical protein